MAISTSSTTTNFPISLNTMSFLYVCLSEAQGMVGDRMKQTKKVFVGIVSVLAMMMLVSSACAFPPEKWNKGDEKKIFGHTFDEEYWTNSTTVKGNSGENITFTASYVNYKNVQAFLFALNKVENSEGTGTIPYQLFGMHYYTPENREVFIGAVLAFLMAFNDTYNGTGPGSNNLPDPGNEKVYYVVPFGVGKTLNETYPPQVNAIGVQKLGDGHYKFGMQYKNLYAFVVENFLLSALLRTGWIAKFSELTITYEITIGSNGEVKAETWYTLGEVSKLWAVILGIPIEVSPHALPPKMGISVVHFATVFTSKYQYSSNTTGNTINTDITAPTQDINIKVGDDSERALNIGFRGTFDLINETTGYVIKKDQPAYNAIIKAKAVDLFLLAWQLGFSGGIMSIFAYALSDYVQTKYSGPLDLYQRSLQPNNNDGFNAMPLWYAVSFPQWNGYKVVHDPVYTAYANLNPPGKINPAVILVILIIAVVAVIVVLLLVTRKRKGP